jgi:hypothetical protein
MAFNRIDEHFKDFAYQQEIDANVKNANSEQIPGPVSKYSIKFFKYSIFF